MTLKTKMLILVAGAFTLSACTSGSMSEFYSEAGAEVDEGGFGNPTMNNSLAQLATACIGQAKGYVVPEPIVVLDPNSPADRPRYLSGQVRCLGELNGKYAEVIFREYIQSATFAPLVREADAGANSGG